MMVRILHVVQDHRGGGPWQAAQLAADAVDSGHAVTVAGPGDLIPQPVASVERFRLPQSAWKRNLALIELAERSDLVHAHGLRAAAWLLPALKLRPSLVTFHGLHPLRRTRSSTYRAAGRALVVTVTGLAKAVICVSRAEASDLLALPIDPMKLHVVANAVPARPHVDATEAASARAELGLGRDQLAALFLGRLHEQKDPLRALRVAQRLARHNFLLLIAGDGEMREEVQRRAGANVRLLGWRADVRKLLAACDLVLNMSRWEGLPLSVLEAMWAGRPVVASSNAGNVETIGDTGLIVPLDHDRSDEREILRLRDPDLRVELARRARARVERRFSFDLMLRDTRLVYASVLAKSV
jgi:glycosyltransferase involved in cell wall biosynthesis